MFECAMQHICDIVYDMHLLSEQELYMQSDLQQNIVCIIVYYNWI